MVHQVAENTLLKRPAVSDQKAQVAEDNKAQVEQTEWGGVTLPANNNVDDGSDAVPVDDRQPSLLMQALLCCIASLEGADEVLLGACMQALQADIGLKITELGYMAVAMGVATNLGAPFWGILADRGILQRRTILLLGSMGQGIVTMSLAFVTEVWMMVILRALNGFLLASLRPISNGIVADTTSEQYRGKIFGRIQSALLMGMFVTTILVVPMAPARILGFQGWRVAYILVGCISVIASMLVTCFMVEPPRQEQAEKREGGRGRLRGALEEVQKLLEFFKMPTFCVMIMQGIAGSIPWTVFGYMALYFQLCGVDNVHVAVLAGMGPLVGAIGNMIGGLVADCLAVRFKLHGRPLSAQITVALGVPLIYMMFQGIPAGSGTFGAYMALNIAFGLLATWAQSGTNFPILSHIVPPSARSSVMAWECALEHSVAAIIGPTVVGNLASIFGYTFGTDHGTGVDLKSANALGAAMAVVICGPWVLCFFAYMLLHWTYPLDVKRLEAREEAAKAEQAAGAERRKAERLEAGSEAEAAEGQMEEAPKSGTASPTAAVEPEISQATVNPISPASAGGSLIFI